MDTPAPHRLAAALLALAAVFTLILQTIIDTQAMPLGPSLWDQALFFTNLCVAWVALICGWVALRGWPGPSWPGALTVWIVMTGLVYHLLLAKDHSPEGWDVLVNFFQHTGLPIGVALAWVAFAPKALSLKDPFLWVIWPMAYAVYALIRGLTGSRFPYFFLDPVKSGWGGVAAYILGLGVVFLAVGLLLYAVARMMARANPEG